MATGRNFLEYVLEQLSELEDVTYYPMMGEYVIYYQEKVIGGIYDYRFLVKNTASARAYMERNDISLPLETPYQGAKPMIAVDIDDRRTTCELIEEIWKDLPEKKKRKK
ncbi:MAG: competence protein TfoX [Erysipelotrichaceae bacterium]|nr:competence protein TfoX [Erysipelotrichaceae bacterium]MBR2791296.1 competence protein TfoX [Erysipelotrichaceae bacterium]